MRIFFTHPGWKVRLGKALGWKRMWIVDRQLVLGRVIKMCGIINVCFWTVFRLGSMSLRARVLTGHGYLYFAHNSKERSLVFHASKNYDINFFYRRILEHTGSKQPAQSLALSTILGATCTWHEIHVLHRWVIAISARAIPIQSETTRAQYFLSRVKRGFCYENNRVSILFCDRSHLWTKIFIVLLSISYLLLLLS